MPKWTEYTSKDTLADNDEVMLYDATAKANKRGLMSKFWDYVVDKMATAVISKLETDNKTIIGAINALKGKTELVTRKITISDSNKKIYDLDIDANKYMVISLQTIDRKGWSCIPTRGVSSNETPNNWAVTFIENPSDTYTFLIAIIKR